jgi:hypothetical protein
VAVGGVDDDGVDARLDSVIARLKASSPTPTAAATTSRPSASLVASGNWSRLT